MTLYDKLLCCLWFAAGVDRDPDAVPVVNASRAPAADPPISPVGGTDGAASSSAGGNGIDSRERRRAHRRVTRHESRYHSEVRQEAVQQVSFFTAYLDEITTNKNVKGWNVVVVVVLSSELILTCDI